MPRNYGARWMISILLLLFTSCDAAYEMPSQHGEELVVNSTLGDLRTRYAGKATQIEEELIVSGRVTSSDRAGNFYRSLTIEAGEAAAELMVGLDHLHNDYPIGTKLYVRLQGLTVGEQHGIVQIGRAADPHSGFATDYLSSKASVDQHIIRSSDPIAEPMPATYRIEELRPEMAGRLIRIEQLTHHREEATEPITWGGEHVFTDATNNLIYIFVRTYADFSDRLIPAHLSALVGILQCSKGQDGSYRYQLKPRDEEDLVP